MCILLHIFNVISGDTKDNTRKQKNPHLQLFCQPRLTYPHHLCCCCHYSRLYLGHHYGFLRTSFIVTDMNITERSGASREHTYRNIKYDWHRPRKAMIKTWITKNLQVNKKFKRRLTWQQRLVRSEINFSITQKIYATMGVEENLTIP